MDARLKRKALTLWRAFALQTYSLDMEAIDALLLRDQLDAAELIGPERAELSDLDHQIEASRAERVRDLERSGAMDSIRELRDTEKASGRWWWWLDFEPPAEPVELTTPTAVAQHRVRPVQVPGRTIHVPDFLRPLPR